MSTNFEWQTDETEQLWDQQPPEPPPPPTNRRRRWLIFALIGAVLLAAGAGVAYQVNQRVNDVTAELSNSVFSSANLLHQAVASQDEELFLNIVSGADTDWVDDQLTFFNQPHFYDRELFGLTAKSLPPLVFEETNPSAVAHVTFTPELNEAQVHTFQPYIASLPDGSTDSITLEQVTVFRPGASRWLMANPSAEFWGMWQSESGDPIDVGYFERDEAVVAQLRDDMTDVVAQVCSDIDGLDCPDDLHLTLNFWDDPSMLTRFAPLTTQDNALQIELPSPTIIGLPIDAAGEDVLKRGYGRLVATAVIAHLTGYKCCQHGAFFFAMADTQLADLGLLPPPVSAEMRAAHHDSTTSLRDLSQLWPHRNASTFTNEEMALSYLFADFVHTTYPDIPLADLQRTMSTSSVFRIWIDNAFASIAPDQLASNKISNDWWIYLYERGQNAISAEMPIASQSVQLICEADDGLGFTAFDPVTQSFGEIALLYNGQEVAIAVPAPNDEGTIASMVFTSTDRINFEIGRWVNDEWRLIEAVDNNYIYTLGLTDPGGTELLTFGIDFEQGDVLPHLNDLTQCDDGGCSTTDLAGVPIWSPDGSRVLLSPVETYDMLFLHAANYLYFFSSPYAQLGDLARLAEFWQRPVAEISAELGESTNRGYAPFWVSNDVYGYLAFDDFPATQLVLADTETDDEIHTISAEVLTATLPDDDRPERLIFAYALANPVNSDQLVLAALSPSNATNRQEVFLFLYNHVTEELDPLMSMAPQLVHMIGYSPDGRYLTIMDLFSSDLGRWATLNGDSSRLILIDTATGTQSVFPGASNTGRAWGDLTTFDWTSDGQWLTFMLDENTLALVHPQTQQAQAVGSPVCQFPIWTQPTAAE